MAGWRRAALAVGAGVLIAAGQAPLGAWWLAVPALAGLIRLVAAAPGARQAAVLGLMGGAGYFAAALSWIIEPFLIDAARDGWMAPFAVVLLAFGLGLFWGGAAALARRSAQPALMFATALSGVELLRGYLFTGFPWASIGHVWIGTPVAQLAAYAGAPGLTLLTCLAAALIAGLRARPAATGGAALALAWGFGAWQLTAPEPPAPGVTLRLVQPNAEQHLKWDASAADMFFNRLLDHTAATPRPDLVIWPETALPYQLERNPGLAEEISATAGGVPVALGVQRVEGTRGYNSLAVLGAKGAVTARYDKHHLVPFGEYIPFGDLAYRWFGLRAFAAQTGNAYSAGPGPVVLDLGPKLGRVLPLICYEAVFPQDLRGAGRADWLLQITNDAWFGTLTGPFQHAAQARLRAIEQGLPMVRVANTGVTAVYDARGRITASLPFGTQGHLDTALPGALPETFYARWGEAPVGLLLAGLAAALIRRRPRPLA